MSPSDNSGVAQCAKYLRSWSATRAVIFAGELLFPWTLKDFVLYGFSLPCQDNQCKVYVGCGGWGSCVYCVIVQQGYIKLRNESLIFLQLYLRACMSSYLQAWLNHKTRYWANWYVFNALVPNEKIWAVGSNLKENFWRMILSHSPYDGLL